MPRCCRDVDDAIAKFITGDAFFLMFAGTDTAAFYVMRALVLLHEHPQWFRRLQKEQDSLRQEHGETIDRKVMPCLAHPTVTIVRCTRVTSACASCQFSAPARARSFATPFCIPTEYIAATL